MSGRRRTRADRAGPKPRRDESRLSASSPREGCASCGSRWALAARVRHACLVCKHAGIGRVVGDHPTAGLARLLPAAELLRAMPWIFVSPSRSLFPRPPWWVCLSFLYGVRQLATPLPVVLLMGC